MSAFPLFYLARWSERPEPVVIELATSLSVGWTTAYWMVLIDLQADVEVNLLRCSGRVKGTWHHADSGRSDWSDVESGDAGLATETTRPTDRETVRRATTEPAAAMPAATRNAR